MHSWSLCFVLVYGVMDPNLSMKMQLDSCCYPSLQHQTNHYSSYSHNQQQLNENVHQQNANNNHFLGSSPTHHHQMSLPSPGHGQHTMGPPSQQQQFQVPQKFESPNYYLPLVDCDFKQLPVHFLLNSEVWFVFIGPEFNNFSTN